MRLLVLGGTRFVGRAVVVDALARGWEVTTLHRGITGTTPAGAHTITVDRTDPAALAGALGSAGNWDLVVDTWSGAARVATAAARALEGRADRYGYVSTGSVYEWGHHVDESSPLVAGDPEAGEVDYGADKRGAELGVVAAFPDALLARAGLILGPHEDIGRLPWWLERTARGGPILAPGRPDRPLQYVDVRDLAAWMLDGLAGGLTGPVDTVSPSGHTTTAGLLEACIAATRSANVQTDVELVWVEEEALADAGVEAWTQLPCWVPEVGDAAGFLEGDTSLAAATGLRCRPVTETVADTWAWMLAAGPQRKKRNDIGLPPDLEARVLDTATPPG